MLDALPAAPATVVDAGGGAGQLAVALAGAATGSRWSTTSAAMLATCAQRAADAGAEVAERVTGIQEDAADLPGLLGPDSQDAAVCRDLLTRVDDQAVLLTSLAGALAAGGVLSRWGSPTATGWPCRPAAAATTRLLLGSAGRRGDQSLVPSPPVGGGEALTLAEAETELDKAGFELVAASGVGCSPTPATTWTRASGPPWPSWSGWSPGGSPTARAPGPCT